MVVWVYVGVWVWMFGCVFELVSCGMPDRSGDSCFVCVWYSIHGYCTETEIRLAQRILLPEVL